MIVGISHDESVIGGGIDSSKAMKPGEATVAPIAWITPSGHWLKHLCNDAALTGSYSKACLQFERTYLKKPHVYSVISADGKGTPVQVARMDLDHECFGAGGEGTFPPGSIRYASVGAESDDLFTDGPAVTRLSEVDAAPIRKALAAAVGSKLDSTKELRLYSFTLEGRGLVAIQRAFQDYADKPPYRNSSSRQLDWIFAIGEMLNGRFHLLHWKENTEDDNEQILGLIHMKNGREFLVNAANDPETYRFRIYGIRNGKLAMVFEGGGGGC